MSKKLIKQITLEIILAFSFCLIYLRYGIGIKLFALIAIIIGILLDTSSERKIRKYNLFLLLGLFIAIVLDELSIL